MPGIFGCSSGPVKDAVSIGEITYVKRNTDKIVNILYFIIVMMFITFIAVVSGILIGVKLLLKK